ncbi:Alg9-like mannosyltransferase family-domain-containing protein [Scheffersomyces xylosifermentans]|uniref:Alg9-like mannosyltransferase family-domain-containing protein n=1 Tax=Scheffersomyces xylosifermentans TaxID=1304137 RepID=UPI00315D1D96
MVTKKDVNDTHVGLDHQNFSKSRFKSHSLKPYQYIIIGFNILLRVYSSLYMIIADCDETYNYWEPLNVLFRHFGKQTWEYSPEYAIRDYVYLFIYYTIGYPIQFFSSNFEGLPYSYSYYQFYAIRFIALNGFTSYAEIRLFQTINQRISAKVANWFLFFSSIAPGMSHAGVALLPSSFAMQCNCLGISNGVSAIVGERVDSYVYAILWFIAGGIIGWPFALALGLAFGLYTLLNISNWKNGKIVSIIIGCIAGSSIIVGTVVVTDSYLYSKNLLVPLNIVLYNVFGGEGEGPEIFGVEDFSYYVLNLLLNFNIIAILAYVGLVVNPILYGKITLLSVISSVPLFIWSFIFFSQPHKEERFLYPIYPLISLNAALLTPKLFTFVNRVVEKVFPRHQNLQRSFSALSQVVFVLLIFVISFLRIVNLVENYSAPLESFTSISQLEPSDHIKNVCMGREWYHYPNSFFLPDNFRLRFVKSGFDGLLPGDFNESYNNLRDITSYVPPNMNNKNLFEEDKVIDFALCDYYVDNTQQVGEDEYQIIKRNEEGQLEVDPEWKVLECNKLINPDGNHRGIGRLIYVPVFLRSLIPYQVEYMDFCSLERKREIV